MTDRLYNLRWFVRNPEEVIKIGFSINKRTTLPILNLLNTDDDVEYDYVVNVAKDVYDENTNEQLILSDLSDEPHDSELKFWNKVKERMDENMKDAQENIVLVRNQLYNLKTYINGNTQQRNFSYEDLSIIQSLVQVSNETLKKIVKAVEFVYKNWDRELKLTNPLQPNSQPDDSEKEFWEKVREEMLRQQGLATV